MPKDEIGRVMKLADLDLDYTNLNDNFKDLTRLAANVAGTDISLVNLIDSFTQWSVSTHGMTVEQMPREGSVCQYTIAADENFEVKDLTTDERFKDSVYLSDDKERLKYYYGIPLKTEGHNLGALCVLDSKLRILSPEKVELLQIIADEIVNRIKTLKIIQDLSSQVKDVSESQRRVAHDIRGPLGGIIGLARIISEQGNANDMDEVLEFVNLIHKSGNSILELADEILTSTAPKKTELGANEFNLLILKEKLVKLYGPQAINKHIDFQIAITPETAHVPFSKDKLLQIIGNLISNSMKFTPIDGKINVDLTLKLGTTNILNIIVKDNGVGMEKEKIEQILNGGTNSTDGTSGEQGYGFGLALVKHLIDSLKGTLAITSAVDEGTTFNITIPQRH